MSGDKDWAVLVPELMVSDVECSRDFYCGLCGFSLRYERPEDRFPYLQMGGAQIMLEEVDREEGWVTGPLERPFGRGINLQIEVADVAALSGRLEAAGIRPFKPLHEAWYRDGTAEHGQMQVLVQDPDGYLLRFVEDLGTRSVVDG